MISIIYFVLVLLLLIIIFKIYKINLIKKDNINHTKRKCFTNKMSNKQRRVYINLLKLTTHILNKNNIDWIPQGGNLLAIYREKKLFIKWDDDFDIAINKYQIKKALSILKEKLPMYDANLVFHRKHNEGVIYKISFTKKSKKYIKSFNIYTWPYIDIFVNVKPDNNPTSEEDLNYDEYPLLKMKIDGINVNIPSKGKRSYNSYKKFGFLDTCVEQDWVHSLEKSIPCIGKKKILCKELNL